MKTSALAVLALGTLSLGACSSPTLRGAAIGTAGGAGVAAVTGNDVGDGATAGAVAGGVIGAIDPE